MLSRRVDKTDPKTSGAVQKFIPPQEWLEDTRFSSYDALLSTITMLASTTVISALPDVAALSIICAGTLVLNIKPYAPKKDGTDMSSNAYASLVFSVFMNVFLVARKPWKAFQKTNLTCWLTAVFRIAAVAATPVYLLQAIRTRRFTMHGMARYNWVLPILGAGIGAGTGWMESVQISAPLLAYRASAVRADSERMRRDDFHLIGSVVGALTLPALFLRRVGLINGLLGGAGLGGAIGVLTFYGKLYSEDKLKDVPIPGTNEKLPLK